MKTHDIYDTYSANVLKIKDIHSLKLILKVGSILMIPQSHEPVRLITSITYKEDGDVEVYAYGGANRNYYSTIGCYKNDYSVYTINILPVIKENK